VTAHEKDEDALTVDELVFGEEIQWCNESEITKVPVPACIYESFIQAI